MKNAYFAALLAISFGSAAFAQIDSEAKKIVTRAIEVHGGMEVHKKYPVREISFDGTWSLKNGESLKIKSVSAFALPDKSRNVMELVDRKSTVEVIVNGDKFKQVINGKVEELKSDALKQEYLQSVAINDVTQFHTLLDGEAYKVKLAPLETVGTKDCETILVTKKGMKDLKMNFDKSSGKLIRYSYKTIDPFDTKKEVDQETIQSEFKEFSGLLLPTEVVLKQAGKETMKLKVIDVKLLEKADPKAYKVD